MNQIAALLATSKPAITVKYMDTQTQCRSTDCGIFAIAFATALANGKQPGGLRFEQPQMRKHLMHCLETQCLSGFPVTRRRRRRAARVKLSSTLHVYYSCRMPEQAGSTMTQCSTCKEWFHVGVCVDVYPFKRLTLPPNGFVTSVIISNCCINCTDVRCIIHCCQIIF